MREFIYFSNAKLDQIEVPDIKFARLIQRLRATVKSPLAELEIKGESRDEARENLRKFEQVEQEILFISKWWEDSSVCPGDWVQFERPMSYYEVEPAQVGDSAVVLFIDENDGSDRLLLYGSQIHLLTDGRRGKGAFVRPVGGPGGGSARSAGSFAAQALLLSRRPWIDRIWFKLSRTSHEEAVELLYKQAEDNSDLDGVSDNITMSGLARVSRILQFSNKRVVMASPLNVEYQRAE